MRYIRLLAVVVLWGTLCTLGWSQNPPAEQNPPTEAHFTLWQLPPQTYSQNMAYVLKTSHDKIVVVDGGTRGDAPYLRGFLARLGNHVDAWFLSHAHDDHIDALNSILEDPKGVRIDEIYASFNDNAWEEMYEPTNAQTLLEFRAALKNANRSYTELQLGQVLTIDGVKIEVLGVKNPEFHGNAINESSVVIRFSDAKKSVMFLGDLGVEGGKKLLVGPFKDHLHADYLQMAHHGQNGCNEDLYRAVKPDYCLWPTPRWLWDNDREELGRQINGDLSGNRAALPPGHGKGTGPWQTLVVRGWMEKLGVRKNYVAADGLCHID